jgi:shikimate kinase
MVKDIDQRPIVLSGLMGSGKSSVAKALASRMNRVCIDLDEMIEAKTGLSVTQWFEEHGEARFRRIEAETIRELLQQSAPKVVALGGGAVPSGRNTWCAFGSVLIGNP